jgi:uncharacterized membrane protein
MTNERGYKNMKRLFISVAVCAASGALVAFFDVQHLNKTAEVFYTVCCVFFSVGMVQTMTFDFGKVADDENYRNLSSALSVIRLSFIIQFIAASLSFLVLQILKSDNSPDPISVAIKCLSLIIMHSLFLFLYDFYELARYKSEIDRIIRDEAQKYRSEQSTGGIFDGKAGRH